MAPKRSASPGGRGATTTTTATGPVWSLEPQAALQKLGCNNLTRGLDSSEAARLLQVHGHNELEKEPARSFWALVLEQFDDPLVKVLLVAASVSTVIAFYETREAGQSLSFDKFVEPIVIVLILVLNAAIGVFQESSAEKSLEALKDMQPSLCHVLRDGEWHANFESRELVPGDVVKLTTGALVPADCRIVKLISTTLRAEQSALTGEAVAVLKQSEAISASASDIQQRNNMCFAGTTVASGSALAVVSGTGMNTEIGKIQDQIKEAEEATREEKTPLKEKLDEFSDQLQWLITLVCVVVWIINIRQFVSWDRTKMPPVVVDFKRAIFYFQIAVSLAVAAIPEGLPTVITMCLALGTRKMAKKNCIVRQLPAVETLGCTTVICSDKTGTLTTNNMTCRRVVLIGRQVDVSGSSYNPSDGTLSGDVAGLDDDVAVQTLQDICAMCNESDVMLEKNSYKCIGAPTEAALLVLVEKLARERGDVAVSNQDGLLLLPACANIKAKHGDPTFLEFTRDRKSMSTLCKGRTSKNRLLCKGAPETVLARCTMALQSDGSTRKLTTKDRDAIMASVLDMSTHAWRCLGFAVKDQLDKVLLNYDRGAADATAARKLLSDTSNFDRIESDMIWVGVVGMQDPPRPEVRPAISACRQAGIRVIVITGDNQTTANAIAKDIGVFTPEDLASDPQLKQRSFVGSEFWSKSDAEKTELLWNSNASSLVFARAEPKFKQDIVTLLKAGSGDDRSPHGEIVAMTGDGVNDAPALKMADIGIAMGIAGTEVAKGASDMILADDNFSTIVAAIEEGRSIYSNMKAFIRYMISSNIGEVASIFLTAALGFPEGMISVQLLWVNLVTDGPPATALGFNKSEPDVMRRPPRHADDALIGKWASFRFLVIGTYVGVATVGILATWFTHTHFMGLDLSQDGHSAVSLRELMNWEKCNVQTNMFHFPGETPYKFSAKSWTATGPWGGMSRKPLTGCDYFGDEGKMKASTLSLTVLVIIEMMNACNALSEDSSLLTVTPLTNPYLMLAISASVGVHLMILYVPQLNPYFDVVPLSRNEWLLVILFSFPVIIIDEILKVIARNFIAKAGHHHHHAGGSGTRENGSGHQEQDDEEEEEEGGETAAAATTTTTTARKRTSGGKKKGTATSSKKKGKGKGE